jgi:hypothetical protein
MIWYLTCHGECIRLGGLDIVLSVFWDRSTSGNELSVYSCRLLVSRRRVFGTRSQEEMTDEDPPSPVCIETLSTE